ncbi:TetR/AcrR family transcriptional regulator [Amycolatopsis sp. DG1A-15b]|uniref:TetR/AcrR family transcriptional regulator n=1 Tax=Amycolatopsis sp. DG1A-15b TaxID=3052846 RepID=UPI00255BDE23|nr:TetR/AcrR family transcriptional regulator [Amycolatopsis sp. DG1A-15b]WIX91432.1 TetR/AcrR family transcriptional regulator [Amycolatopsis sp. DG1A-15b]
MPEQQLTRRDRYRRRTVAEIKEAAMAQVRSGGPEALSLAAVARTMAMSAPALYRYFAGRDELLAELAVDAHLALARTLEAAAAGATTPASRLRAVAIAYREWALAQPHAYRLACESPHGCVASDAQRSMNVLLDVVAEAGAPPDAAGVRHFGLVWWSRLHGLISLELGQHTVGTGIDPGLLYRSEVETMVDSLRHRVTAGPRR